MSTNGFISFIANGEVKNSYSHWDSGPDRLGIALLRWLRVAVSQPDLLKAAIMELKVVSDDDGPPPTAAEVSSLRRHRDKEAGSSPDDEWYSLLYRTQGDPAKILACGYIVDEGAPYGWIYEVNTDQQTLSVNCDDYQVTWPWSALPADKQFLAETNV
jgi:hypothetical protein